MKYIYLDENFSPYIAEAFNSFEKPQGEIRVLSTVTVFKDTGATDPEVIKMVAENNGVLISKDHDFRQARMYLPLVKEYGIGFIHMKPPKGANNWKQVEMLIRAWPEIRSKVLKPKTPFFFQFKQTGKLEKLSL